MHSSTYVTHTVYRFSNISLTNAYDMGTDIHCCLYPMYPSTNITQHTCLALSCSLYLTPLSLSHPHLFSLISLPPEPVAIKPLRVTARNSETKDPHD